MPPTFGGAPSCPRCTKAVYMAEQITGPGGMWHKTCLTCKECNKRLDSTNVTERDKEAYCKTCYGKKFGPKGYGFGGGAGVLSTDSTITSEQKFSPPSTPPTGHLAEKTKLSNTLALSSNACPRCTKTVYFAEQVLGPGGVKYHKLCLGVDSTTVAEKDNVIYCRACHGKKFGPKGYGYAAGASFMHTEGSVR
ncbi:hypothetical protein BC829DRAFT_397740 [Chytridium lagenaria]|nr:hypothetical protein BC829DRAFT_397740 [Chytridium lagenaria]